MAIIYGIPDTERFRKKIQNQNRSIKRSLLRGEEAEQKALEKLSELDDNHHILCGIRIVLHRSVTYHGKKDLKKGQLDFVVVSRAGIVVIEVKDWSDEFLSKELSEIRKYGGRLPHEQVDRNGLVLWIDLQWRLKNPPVTRVLLDMNGNMQYDPNYEFVNVKNLKVINDFIQNKYDEFSDDWVHNTIGKATKPLWS